MLLNGESSLEGMIPIGPLLRYLCTALWLKAKGLERLVGKLEKRSGRCLLQAPNLAAGRKGSSPFFTRLLTFTLSYHQHLGSE